MSDLRQRVLELLTVEQRRLFGYVITLLPNFDDAEEAFQETCLRICAKADQFDASRDFLAWACGFARNVAHEVREKKHRGRELLSEQAMEAIAQTRFQKTSAQEEWHVKLSDCLDRLPREQHELLVRCYAGEERIETIAKSVRVSRAALYMKLMRIRRTLADCLEERDEREANHGQAR
jgi:RNA polymerase sigma-70 factor, ECF subfamily